MCCRYYMELSPELTPYIDAAKRSPLGKKMVAALGKPLVTEGEVFPTNIVPVIASNKNKKQTVFPMVWGLPVQGLSRPVINARVETAHKKFIFKESWQRMRCAIPASWYFEWTHIPMEDGGYRTGDKYAIQPAGASSLFFAGIYVMRKNDQPSPVPGRKDEASLQDTPPQPLTYPVFTILTRPPGEQVRQIHDRMPVILPPSCVSEWINPDANPEDIVGKALTDMILAP